MGNLIGASKSNEEYGVVPLPRGAWESVESQDKTSLGRQPVLRVNWREVLQLLESGQYSQAGTFLQEALQGSQLARDAIFTQYLTVACYLCLMCQQCQSDLQRHQKAIDEIQLRTFDTKQKLEHLIDVISQQPLFTDGSTIDIPTPNSKFHEFLVFCQHLLRSKLEIRLPATLANKRPLRMPRLSQSGETTELEHVFTDDDTPSLTDKTLLQERSNPNLSICCLGPFRVSQSDCIINKWPSGKGKAILKYMVAGYGRPINKSVLLETFWRDADPEAALKNLYVAIHGLRQAFKALQADFSYILYYDEHYFLNPDVDVWIDVEEFYRRFHAGQSLEHKGMLGEAIQEYEAAESLYQGEFLAEDLYEDWAIPVRQDINNNYMIMLERLSQYYYTNNRYRICIQYCQKMLSIDTCQEDAHRRLMCCYMRLGQRNLALRQYHMCLEALQRELGVPPMQETVELYTRICSTGNV